MARPIASNNDRIRSNYPSEDSLINECESCCYELQHARPYSYKCTINDVIHQYKMRLKRAQMELNDRELMIAMMKDQQVKMENYCRSSLEETLNIKAKYNQLVQEMESMRREYENQRSGPNREYLESYLRTELDSWKRENKDMLSKIERLEFDVQKLLQIVSENLYGNADNEMKYRMGKLEGVIEDQSAMLGLLQSKLGEHSRAITYISRNVGSKLDEILGNNYRFRDEVKGPENITYIPDELNIQKETKDSATINTETDIEETKRAEEAKELDTAAKNTYMMADFLEIAANEKTFFDEYHKKLNNPIEHSGSAQISELSELSASEQEKLFRELPVNAISTPKKRNANYEGFDEFEHIESAMLANRETPNLQPLEPIKAHEEEKIVKISEESFENSHLRSIPRCCTITIEKVPERDSNLQIVVFDGIPNNKIPICCAIPRKPADAPESELLHDNKEQTKPSTLSSHEKVVPGYEPFDDSTKPKDKNSINITSYQPNSELPLQKPKTPDETTSLSSKIEEAIPRGVVMEGVSHPTQSTDMNPFSVPRKTDIEEEQNKYFTNNLERSWKAIPECCRIRETPEREILQEETTSSKSPKKNLLQPEKSVDEIISDKLIIYGLETAPKPITEISIKIPYAEDQRVNENDMALHIEDVKHDIPSNNNYQLLEGQLHKVVNELDDVLTATKQEASSLHSLKEKFETIKDLWSQDLPIIKSNIELTNKTLGEMKNDIQNLKLDMEKLISEQEQNKHQNIVMNDSLRKHNEEDTKKVLERVKSLENFSCKCGTRTKKDKICHPSTGCTCKHKINDDSKMMREQKN